MPHTRTWDEASPPGAITPAATLDTIIQNFKTDIREREALEHNWNGSPNAPSTTYDGQHLEGSARILWVALASIPVARGTTPINGAGGNEEGRVIITSDTGEILVSDNNAWVTALKKITGPLNVTGTFQLNGVTIGALATRAVPARSFTIKTGNQSYTASAEIAITTLSNIAVPGTPDGAKKYRVTAVVNAINDHGSLDADGIVRIRMGAAGTIADAMVAQQNVKIRPSASQAAFVLADVDITPASGNKITISFASDRDGSIVGQSTARSYVVIEEILV